MAQIIKETVADTLGKEAGLALIGRLFLVAGIAMVLASITAAIIRGEFFWLASGAVCMVLGIVLFIIFSALSEIIALLKKLCGLPCSTHISGTSTGTIFLCSECGSMTWADSLKCNKCGAEFDSEESDPAVLSGTGGDMV
jgi:predicted RNA-binding Zn-ribbon protein involved in translation (DUF1610 family)